MSVNSNVRQCTTNNGLPFLPRIREKIVRVREPPLENVSRTVLAQAHIERPVRRALSRSRRARGHGAGRCGGAGRTVTADARWTVTSVRGLVVWVGERPLVGTESERLHSSFAFDLLLEPAQYAAIRVSRFCPGVMSEKFRLLIAILA